MNDDDDDDDVEGTTYLHVYVQVKSIWRQLYGSGRTDKENLNARVGFVQICKAGDVMGRRSTDHWRTQSDQIESRFLSFHVVPCWETLSLGPKAYRDQIMRSRKD